MGLVAFFVVYALALVWDAVRPVIVPAMLVVASMAVVAAGVRRVNLCRGGRQ